MSEKNGTQGFEEDAPNEEEEEDEKILQFLDSMDSYLTLLDSLSSTLRQGWMELASARHSMGASRISSALFDLKLHPAVTTLQVNLPYDESASGDPNVKQPHFTLHKWASPSNRKCDSGEVEFDEELLSKSYSSQVRRRGPSNFTDVQEKDSERNEAPLTLDDQIQKERSKSLSVFGTLVSPKLRTAQVSFETALETLVNIANMRSSILSANAQIR